MTADVYGIMPESTRDPENRAVSGDLITLLFGHTARGGQLWQRLLTHLDPPRSESSDAGRRA